MACFERGATVLNEGRVRHGSSMLAVNKRSSLDGNQTKVKGAGTYATVKLGKQCWVNSMSIRATNRSADPNAAFVSDGFKIFVSLDNSSWETLADCRAQQVSGLTLVIVFPPRPVRYSEFIPFLCIHSLIHLFYSPNRK